MDQVEAHRLVGIMEDLKHALGESSAQDAETTRLIEALDAALRWGLIAHAAKHGVWEEE